METEEDEEEEEEKERREMVLFVPSHLIPISSSTGSVASRKV